jgi:hypothetical protein
MNKDLKDITREEWIKYQWMEDNVMGVPGRIFQRGYLRTPDEAYQAMIDWDSTSEERESEDTNE